MSYEGLETLKLELTRFELKDWKSQVISIIKHHRETLRVISFGKNEISYDLIKDLCEEMKGMNVIEEIGLLHLKKVN